MTDLITPVILLTFGAGGAVIIAGFYLLFHRNTRSPFRNEDYSNFSQRNSMPRYTPSDPFRRQGDLRKKPNKRALITMVLVLLLIAAAVASTLSDALDLLLVLVFLAPFLLGLLRSRRRERDEEGRPDDERKRSA